MEAEIVIKTFSHGKTLPGLRSIQCLLGSKLLCNERLYIEIEALVLSEFRHLPNVETFDRCFLSKPWADLGVIRYPHIPCSDPES